jgi:hypothetical protein
VAKSNYRHEWPNLTIAVSPSIRTKKDVIIEAWENLDATSLGAREIESIQPELRSKINVAGESPASIARTLADHGVKLRHAEVLEADRRWREQYFYGLFRPEELDFSTSVAAFNSITSFTDLFQLFVDENDEQGQKQATELAVKLRTELDLIARGPVKLSEKLLAAEVSEWLLVWLQNPALFADWLSLRLASPDFIGKFGTLGNV